MVERKKCCQFGSSSNFSLLSCKSVPRVQNLFEENNRRKGCAMRRVGGRGVVTSTIFPLLLIPGGFFLFVYIYVDAPLQVEICCNKFHSNGCASSHRRTPVTLLIKYFCLWRILYQFNHVNTLAWPLGSLGQCTVLAQ